ncbi:MAG: 4-hydroxy-tetrahydrodipicolinate reductase [Pirellulaceae bacterium]|nr:4-hydroxy-tetrahydrodipicolinate reductase [Pirellulaceae bacterium]
MDPRRIGIQGAAGRMGKRLVALAAADKQLQLVAALESPRHPDLGKDAGAVAGIEPLGVPLSADWPERLDVVIDFSVAAASREVARQCVQHHAALVLATTGLDAVAEQEVRAAAGQVPIVWAPNMSLAVNLAMKLARVAAEALRDNPHGVDVEIIERHHRFKEDSPSGTALRFGQIIGQVMGQSRQAHGRHGLVGRRPADEIGYHAVRVGDNPGEHTIVFGLLGESVEIHVQATNRDCYALGALAAAKWVANRPPGIYSMDDVLGLA